MSSGNKSKPSVRHGEGLLEGSPAIDVRLCDGTLIEVDMAAETAIPEDMTRVARAARRAPARLAFWSEQCARQLRAVRHAEFELARQEGSLLITCRCATDRSPKIPFSSTDATAKAMVDMDDGVLAAREALADLRQGYDLLKTLRDAVEHRVFILRRLLGIDQDAA